MNLDELATLLRSASFAFTDEYELQEGIARTMASANLWYQREYTLSKADRVDFFVHPNGEEKHVARRGPGGLGFSAALGIGVEVKIAGGISALTRQLHRYACLEQVQGLLVVTSRNALANLPDEMNGKPVRSVVVRRGLR